jgi:hypothetical protein
MKLRHVLGLLAVLGATPGHAVAGSLDESVRQAVTTAPTLGEAKSNQLATQDDVLQAKGQYLPKLDVESYLSPQWADKPKSLSKAANKKLD